MGQLTESVESGNSGSDNGNADNESEEVSEEEEPSEEEVEEDSDEDEDEEEHAVNSCEDEHDEVDSCGSPSKEACLGEPYDESCEDEPCEEELEEETQNEPCEEVQDADEPTEDEEEPSEEEEESSEEEPDEEPIEEEALEKGPVEDEPNEEEQSDDFEEDPSDDKPSGGSPINRSCSRNNDESSRPCSEKMNMSSDTTPGPKSIHELSANQNQSNNKTVPEKLDTAENTGRKRRSRWDIVGEAKELTECSDSTNAEKGMMTQGLGESKKATKKKRKTWSDENSQVSTESHLENPTITIAKENFLLERQLLQITSKLESGVGNERFRSKLESERQTIILELICKNPDFKPPPDYGHYKNIYVPTKEYPGYNFIGLILGPRGNTMKRMRWETGAKILLRGKSCGPEGTVWHNKLQPDDEVYVMVAADNRFSFDAAVAMVEKLLVPVEDGDNAHKLAQLRELAELNAALRGADTDNYGKHDPCNVCGDAAHPTSACPLTAPGTSSNSIQANFFAEMGGARQNEIDEANIFVGMLPDSLAEANKLRELFSPFGPICMVDMIRDRITGLSKGYGFIRYTDRAYAVKAVAHMNGYKIEGKRLAVRISRNYLPPANQRAADPGHRAVPEKIELWPGPPESRLPETVAPAPSTSYLPVHGSPFSGQYSASLAPSFQTPAATSLFDLPHFPGYVKSLDLELAHFPGYVKSLDPPSQLYRQPTAASGSHSSSLVQFPRDFGGYHKPPTRYFGV